MTTVAVWVAAGVAVLPAGQQTSDAEVTEVDLRDPLADGLFEVKDRASGERTDVAVGDAVDHLAALVRS